VAREGGGGHWGDVWPEEEVPGVGGGLGSTRLRAWGSLAPVGGDYAGGWGGVCVGV